MAWTLCSSPSIIGRRLPMADKAPLLFSPRLGGLFQANAAAQKAMQDITGKVRVEIKQTRGNMRRMALYWDILSTAAPILSNMIEGEPIDENMLQQHLKKRPGIYRK